MRWGILLALAGLAFQCIPAGAQAVQDIKIVTSACQAQSHTAEGAADADLTDAHKAFACDNAVISFFDHENRRIMIQFAKKGDDTSPLLAFAGTMESDGKTLDVERLYLEAGKPQAAAADSACKLFFTQPHLTDIFCGGQVTSGTHRTVAIVNFKADPGQ